MSAATLSRPSPAINSSSSLRQAALKKDMSITQTYYLAHKARGKLSKEAAQADHDLRLLVGHANLLDSLMLELADAEREQERWFNQSVRGAATKAQDRHIQWADRIEEEAEEEYEESSDSDSDSDSDEEEDVEMTTVSPVSSKPAAMVRQLEVDEDMEDDLEEDYAQLELVRTPSHSASSPPELIDHDSEESSDEDTMPPSPPQTIITPVSANPGKEAPEDEEQDSFYEEDYYLPTRNPARLVSAISVY